jgi:hypothetical protein
MNRLFLLSILFSILIVLSCFASTSYSKPIIKNEKNESDVLLKSNFLRLLFVGPEEDILIRNIVKRQTTGQIIKVRKPTLSLHSHHQDVNSDHSS